MQEKQLMQMLGFTEHELKKNMDVLRRDMGGVVKDTQQKVEEAIWQLACASEAAGTPSKDPQVAALEVVAAVAARAALDATGAAPPPSKSNADAVKTLRVGLVWLIIVCVYRIVMYMSTHSAFPTIPNQL